MKRFFFSILFLITAVSIYGCGRDQASPTAPGLPGGLSAGAASTAQETPSGDADSDAVLLDASKSGNKVAVCHIPPGNPENVQLISVSTSAVGAHRKHGDALPGEGVPGSAGFLFGEMCNLVPAAPVDTDGDGVIDDADVCPGYDDSADADGDGVPDGCDCDWSAPQPNEMRLDVDVYVNVPLEREFSFAPSRAECGCGVPEVDSQAIQLVVTAVSEPAPGDNSCRVTYTILIPALFQGYGFIHTLGGPHQVEAYITVGR